MTYPVILRPAAQHQLEEAARWWAENRSVEQAERWYTGFVDALRSLSEDAESCPLAAESREFPFELRELRYGLGAQPTHRAVFTIRPD